MAFLHNIYYQYLSRSYKKAQKLQKLAQIDLNLNVDDARCFIKSTLSTYNFIFLDAFTPSKCPCLWTLEFLNELYSKLDSDGMILTYSNSAVIRSAFIKSGFYVGKILNPDTNKSTGTVATKNIDLIKNHLDEHDLALVNSRAGICYRDKNLDLDNVIITENRNIEVSQSDLGSSSKIMKSYRRNIHE